MSDTGADATEIWFYHLERKSLEAVLPSLLEASLKRDWRALVQCGQADRVEALDAHLWTYRDDSFLPHGRQGDAEIADYAKMQPIWLTAEPENPTKADVVFLLDGAMRADLADFKRCVVVFDGGDATALETAREQWRTLKEAGYALTYWQETPQGKWEKKA